METILQAGLALVIAASAGVFVGAQTPAPARANDTSEALKTLEQVIEQNRKLEQQNLKLIEQVNALRQRLAAQPRAAAQPRDSQPAAVAAANTPVAVK